MELWERAKEAFSGAGKMAAGTMDKAREMATAQLPTVADFALSAASAINSHLADKNARVNGISIDFSIGLFTVGFQIEGDGQITAIGEEEVLLPESTTEQTSSIDITKQTES